jgi:hypothetical protein
VGKSSTESTSAHNPRAAAGGTPRGRVFQPCFLVLRHCSPSSRTMKVVDTPNIPSSPARPGHGHLPFVSSDRGLDELLWSVVGDDASRFRASPRVREVLGERTVFNINSTATGGGVARCCKPCWPSRAGRTVAGDRGRSEVLRDHKRIHNHSMERRRRWPARCRRAPAYEDPQPEHGRAGGARQRRDVVIVHDPQPQA